MDIFRKKQKFKNPGGFRKKKRLFLNHGRAGKAAVLTASQVEIKTWTFQGRTYAYLKLLFPNAGYRVVNWGQATRVRQRLHG